jgi:hypothetical protein
MDSGDGRTGRCRVCRREAPPGWPAGPARRDQRHRRRCRGRQARSGGSRASSAPNSAGVERDPGEKGAKIAAKMQNRRDGVMAAARIRGKVIWFSRTIPPQFERTFPPGNPPGKTGSPEIDVPHRSPEIFCRSPMSPAHLRRAGPAARAAPPRWWKAVACSPTRCPNPLSWRSGSRLPERRFRQLGNAPHELPTLGVDVVRFDRRGLPVDPDPAGVGAKSRAPRTVVCRGRPVCAGQGRAGAAADEADRIGPGMGAAEESGISRAPSGRWPVTRSCRTRATSTG